MDFSTLELQTETSFWLHLEIDGNKLFWDGESVTLDETDKPCRVKLRGAASNEVYKSFSKYQVAESAHRHRIARAQDGQIEALEAKHQEKAEGLMDSLIVTAVEDWENIYFDGKAEPVSKDRVLELIDRTASYSKRQIRAQLFAAIAENRANLTDAA